MEHLVLTDPEIVLEAVKKGIKIAVFALDEAENPKMQLSGVIFHDSANSKPESDFLEPAIKYLEKNFNKDIRLKYLAKLCDVSPSYFSRTFTKNYGKCLSTYLTDLRLDRACQLLSTTTRSAVSIANEVGYVDCGYFYKLFKKKYGLTPLQYRNSAL